MDKLKNQNLYQYYYPCVALGYAMTLILTGFRPGVFATAVMLLALGDFVLFKRFRHMQSLDWVLVCYFLYLCVSVIWLVGGGLPFSVFADEFVCSGLPVLFYLAGRWSDKTEKVYLWFLIAVLFLGFLGLILYVLAPQFYVDYLFNWGYISKADVPTMRVRLYSVTGSTVLGALSVAGMAVSGGVVIRFGKRLLGMISILLCFGFAFLSSQRAAMFVAILMLLFFNYLVFFEFKMFARKYFVIELLVIVLGFAAITVLKYDLAYKFAARLLSLPGAVGQRSEQWVAAVNNMHSFWIGNGLGANGHKALEYPLTFVVADGGLVKMFCESGIVGFSFFLYLLITLFRKAAGKVKECFVELSLISALVLISIGSNVLSFQAVTPIFWFAVGTLATKVLTKEEPK